MKKEFPNKKTQFSKINQPKKNGRIKGVKNTKTILNDFLSCEMLQTNPFTKKEEKMIVKELINLVQIKKAIEGDLNSYKEITDRTEGKIGDKLETTHNVNDFNIKDVLKFRE